MNSEKKVSVNIEVDRESSVLNMEIILGKGPEIWMNREKIQPIQEIKITKFK